MGLGRTNAVAVIVALLVGCGAEARSPSIAAPSSPPRARDVLAALAAHGAIDPPDPSCTDVTGDPADVTLAAIQAHLLVVLAAPHDDGDVARLSVECDDGGPPWRCAFTVRVDADDPWEYGISFELDARGAIDPRSIRCPGTG